MHVLIGVVLHNFKNVLVVDRDLQPHIMVTLLADAKGNDNAVQEPDDLVDP